MEKRLYNFEIENFRYSENCFDQSSYYNDFKITDKEIKL